MPLHFDTERGGDSDIVLRKGWSIVVEVLAVAVAVMAMAVAAVTSAHFAEQQ